MELNWCKDVKSWEFQFKSSSNTEEDSNYSFVYAIDYFVPYISNIFIDN